MARHDNGQIGGRSYDPVQWDFRGDIAEARNYMGIGRQVLGELKRFMALSEIQTHTWRKTLRNGVVIVAMSFIAQEGMADMDKVLIVAPETGGGREKLIGFVVNLADMDRTYPSVPNNAFVGPLLRVLPSADVAKLANFFGLELISLNSGNFWHEPFGSDLQLTRTGIIEDTYDDYPALADQSSEFDKFYYWDTTFEAITTFGPAEVIGKTVEPPDDPRTDLPYQNYTGKGSISPVNSRRLPNKSVGLYCKAANVSRGKITCEDTDTDGFIAVVKKPIEVSFDDASWDYAKTRYTTPYTIYETYTVLANGDVSGTNIHNFPGSPFATNMATVSATTYSNTVTPHNFTFETDTKDEKWMITGEGSVTLFLISNKSVYTVKHTFPDLQFWSNRKKAQSVIEVELGKEFEKIEDAYKITDKIIY